MAYHEFKVASFLGQNLELKEKIYLLGGTNTLAEIFITDGALMYDYKVVVKNYVPLWFIFEDEEGDTYSLACLAVGTHRTNYNSNAPHITTILVKGDDLEGYTDLRLSKYDSAI